MLKNVSNSLQHDKKHTQFIGEALYTQALVGEVYSTNVWDLLSITTNEYYLNSDSQTFQGFELDERQPRSSVTVGRCAQAKEVSVLSCLNPSTHAHSNYTYFVHCLSSV